MFCTPVREKEGKNDFVIGVDDVTGVSKGHVKVEVKKVLEYANIGIPWTSK